MDCRLLFKTVTVPVKLNIKKSFIMGLPGSKFSLIINGKVTAIVSDALVSNNVLVFTLHLANQINIFVSLFPGQEIFAHAGGREIILYWTDFPPANIGVFSKKATRAAAKQILFCIFSHHPSGKMVGYLILKKSY